MLACVYIYIYIKLGGGGSMIKLQTIDASNDPKNLMIMDRLVKRSILEFFLWIHTD